MKDFVFIKFFLEDKNYINIKNLFKELVIEIKDYIIDNFEIEENSIFCYNSFEFFDILNWFE